MTSQAPSEAGAAVRVPVVIGPTAAGKTRLALEMAARNGRIEIISADSRQIYIGMDIGTAKPTAGELRAVPHHLIDIVTPDTLYSAGLYTVAARAAIDAIVGRGNTPLVVGGSGFYVKALFEGLGAPPVDQDLLERLKQRAALEGSERLYEELLAVDPDAARAHSPNNLAKTLRALCCYYQTGVPFSRFVSEESLNPSPYSPAYIGIAPPRDVLYDRINRRVLSMLTDGLVGETEALIAAGYDRAAPGLKTVGYAEVLAHLAGEIDYETMVALIQQSTRRYAKRQMTWFRKVPEVLWMEEGGEWRGEFKIQNAKGNYIPVSTK